MRRTLCSLLFALLLALQVPFTALGAPRVQRAPQSQASIEKKFSRVARFETKLPLLRERVTRSLASPTLGKETALAAIVRIMDTLYIRVGSERYATRAGKDKASFGASSLRKEHVTVEGSTVRFAFRGKSGVAWRREVVDAELARAVKLFLAQPGERLFDVATAPGKLEPVTERHVRSYLAGFGGSPKDFRTYHANRLLESELGKLANPATPLEAERNLKTAVGAVAKQLGHTPGVCRSNYLNPSRLSKYLVGGR
jgi:DNA topoisomerase I